MTGDHLDLPRQMARLLENVEVATSPFLDRILVTFPEYTDHGPHHSRRILAILRETILDAENREYLQRNPWTCFFLLASAHLHDIGMVDFPELRPSAGTTPSPGEIRHTHGQRGPAIVKARWQDFGLENEFQARVIAEIIEHHTGPLDPRHFVALRAYGTEAVNVGFCTACIRLADELDLPKERADRRLAEFITDVRSKKEWQTHYSIGGVIKHPQFRQTVLVECCCRDKDVHRRLKNLETKINKLLAVITTHLDPRIQYTQCLFEIAADGYTDKDLKFTIDENSLWPMIVGDILYHDNRTFIRELVQNAIDACLLRRCREPSFRPLIQVKYDRDRVTVCDNGTGMDMTIIEKYLVRICLSFYASERFAEERELLHYFPISRFGIGIFSCFMVGKVVRIKTSVGDGTTYHLTIRDCRDYVHIEENKELFRGTEVVVELNQSLVDVIRYVRDVFRHTDLPVTYYYPSGDEEELGRRPFTKSDMIAFGYHEYDRAHEYPIPFSASSGFLWRFPKAKKEDADEDDEKSRDHEPSSVLLLMSGIKVGNFDLLPKWCRLGNLRGIVNLRNEERIDITASRNDVVRNEKFDALVQRMEEPVLRICRDLLAEVPESPDRRHNFIRSAIAADKATLGILPFIQEVYPFKLYEVVETDRGYKRLETFSYVPYREAREYTKGRSKEEVFRAFDLYDIHFLNVGRTKRLAVSIEESGE